MAGGSGATWGTADGGFGFYSHAVAGLCCRRRGAASDARDEGGEMGHNLGFHRGAEEGGVAAGGHGCRLLLLMRWPAAAREAPPWCTRRRLKITTTSSGAAATAAVVGDSERKVEDEVDRAPLRRPPLPP
uniref:Uncharacterized protein n=1 Tax=Oryza meridionalis TaxID=40149 RepID=A0A0E0D143_9ORYZ